MNSNQNKANHVLYKLYWSLILRDILYKLGYDSTDKNKITLHNFHKRVLDYKSIAGVPHETVSHFLRDVGVFWAERGIFVRMNRRQEDGIENRPLSDIWDLL
jgi:hypothetical protein